MYIQGALEFQFLGSTQLCNPNNGGGFADNRILPIDLRSFNGNDDIFFRARISGAEDGLESFFIIADSLLVDVTVVKDLNPFPGDTGTFDLLIDGNIEFREWRRLLKETRLSAKPPPVANLNNYTSSISV